MNFDVSRRFSTQASLNEVVKFLEDSFRKTAETVTNNGGTLTVESVNATFGSINRADKTIVEAKEKDGDTLVLASVEYKPSIWFWIFLACGLFTTVGWLIPIAFYLYQKNTVKNGIEEVFNRTENEFRNSKGSARATISSSSATSGSEDVSSKLEKLAALKEKGILTDEEFAAQKAKILGTV
ncbi:MAG: SHOCT domain-containing protein [Treponema sp.]|uniref:SHOCT domain-containing protein n=1 Tax=Treponema sp. TaxID=166 RepID=UPI0025D99CFF|nr:SHOCT domain-containing protein [Treponema sp.]MBQ8680764.1 SHOCT domain-containing protein [Treponema sp.]